MINIIEITLYIMLYFGFVYLNVPYALGEKFANLFPNRKHKIRTYTGNVDDFTTWQKWIRWLAVPGLLIGFLVRKISEFLGFLISPRKYSKLICMSVLIPFILAAALFGLEQLYVLGMNGLVGGWSALIKQCPEGSFIPFSMFALAAQKTEIGEFNIFVELLKVLCVLPLNLFYFATIFGIFEGTTVSLFKEEYETNENQQPGNSLLKKCVESVTAFVKQTRVSFSCRINPNTDTLSGESIQDCYYKPMCKRIFIPSMIILFVILFILICVTGQDKSLVETAWSWILASGLLQAIISFIFTALASLLTHKAYERLPESFREFFDEKLTDAVSAVIESSLFSVDTVLTTHGGPKNPPPSAPRGNDTNFFG